MIKLNTDTNNLVSKGKGNKLISKERVQTGYYDETSVVKGSTRIELNSEDLSRRSQFTKPSAMYNNIIKDKSENRSNDHSRNLSKRNFKQVISGRANKSASKNQDPSQTYKNKSFLEKSRSSQRKKNSCALKSSEVEKMFKNIKHTRNNKIIVDSKKSRNKNKFFNKSQIGTKTNKTMKDRTSKNFYKDGSKVSQFTRFLQNYQRMRESSAKTNDSVKKRSPFNKHHMLIDIGSKNSKKPKTKAFFPKSQKSQKSKETHNTCLYPKTYSNNLQSSKYKNLHRKSQYSSHFKHENSSGTYQIIANNSASPDYNTNRSRALQKTPKDKSPYTKRMVLKRARRNKSKNNLNKVTSLTINNYHCKGVKIGVPQSNVNAIKQKYF